MSTPSTPGTLSTHVLDAAYGVPAAGLAVVWHPPTGEARRAVTDDDGRVAFDEDAEAGEHALVFATGPWFDASERATFFPEVRLAFTVSSGHHHVALLLSPYSYTTYRGS